LWLYDEPTESMTLRLIADSTDTFDSHEDRLLTKSPLSWGENAGYEELLFAACPVLCEDTATDPRLCGEMRDYFLMTGVKKFLAVPILAEGRIRGMITVRHDKRPPYRTEEVGPRPSSDAGHPAHRGRRAEPASRRFGRTK